MKYFWYLPKKKVNILFILLLLLFFFFFFTFAEKSTFFPNHFSLILLGSARLVGTILGVNTVCT